MVRDASASLRGHIVDTPCTASPALSELTGAEVWVKLENLQRTGSFKDRGARNRLLALSDAERARGVVAASAGNHGQGVAYAARALGVPATIVVPDRTPFTKIARTQQLGATVVVQGADVEASMASARELASRDAMTFVHPYDDPLVIAGQGTAGLEIVDAVPDAEVVVVPVGGGGLLAGVAVAMRGAGSMAELVGVQTEEFASMARAVRDGSAAPPDARDDGDVTTIAD